MGSRLWRSTFSHISPGSALSQEIICRRSLHDSQKFVHIPKKWKHSGEHLLFYFVSESSNWFLKINCRWSIQNERNILLISSLTSTKACFSLWSYSISEVSPLSVKARALRLVYTLDLARLLRSSDLLKMLRALPVSTYGNVIFFWSDFAESCHPTSSPTVPSLQLRDWTCRSS